MNVGTREGAFLTPDSLRGDTLPRMPHALESPPLRVLVVEDDEKLCALLCRALSDDGFRGEPAFDGLTALRRLSEEPFGAVLLDVGLPGMDGLEVCARLRASGSSMPVIVVSARGSVEDVFAGRRAGATDYLLKPFSLQELATRLHELTGSSEPHRRLIATA